MLTNEQQLIIQEGVESVRDVLGALDAFTDDEAEENTPVRWLKAIAHYCQPYNPKADLGKWFTGKNTGSHAEGIPDAFKHGMIIQTNIPYRALCAHHLLPVLGVAHVGYVPKEAVVGLSKLARVVYGISHSSPSMQEDVGNSIVDSIMACLEAHGAMCIITAEHGCMGCRGIEEPHVETTTSHCRGVFIDKMDARSEFLQIVTACQK